MPNSFFAPRVLWCSVGGLALFASMLSAQESTTRIEPLQQLNSSLQALTTRIAPSVVQIQATRFGSSEDPAAGQAGLVVSKERIIGSGVLVDATGYILTNAHVVEGAEKIRVLLVPQAAETVRSVLSPTRSVVRDASLVGVYKEGDLALLKIAAGNLPAPLPFADYRKIRQGDLVFAYGSPAGLQNSVSMGIVSSIARQPNPDSPVFYIQTDAPINRGNSGGPLVDINGEIVGINTAILSESGGSEGIGFAIPSTVAQFVYGELKQHGHVHRLEVGLSVQAITEPLARALDLGRQWGVLIVDVTPGSPAETAGLLVNDVLLAADGRDTDTVVAFQGAIFRHGKDPHIKLTVLRGEKEIAFDVTAVEAEHAIDHISDLVSSDENIIGRLGILAFTVDESTRPLLGKLRLDSGVVVAARTAGRGPAENGLQTGDVIHTVNGQVVENLVALRTALQNVKPNDALALLVERAGSLQYVVFGDE